MLRDFIRDLGDGGIEKAHLDDVSVRKVGMESFAVV